MSEINSECRACCICESIETSKWVRYKNRRGVWDKISYLCKRCYERLRIYGTTDKYKIEEYREQYNEYKKNKVRQTYCQICKGRETGKNFNRDPIWNRYRGNDGKGVWDGKSYICNACYLRIYRRYSDNDSISQLRKGYISKYSDKGKGIIVEMAITKARVANNRNLELDDFNASFDIIDVELNRLQVKGPTLERSGLWHVNIGTEYNFDNLFVVCMDINRGYIKRIYIIPESELFGETRLYIYEDYSSFDA